MIISMELFLRFSVEYDVHGWIRYEIQYTLLN